jgi:hypothetical protein
MNTMRYGWNQRGGTDAQMFRISQEMAQRANPDSEYWEGIATHEMKKLHEVIGDDNYRLFLATFDIDDMTWKDIFERVVFFNPQDIECTCNGDQPCRVCQAARRLLDSEKG